MPGLRLRVLWVLLGVIAVALGVLLLPPAVAVVLLAQASARPVFGGLRRAGRRAWVRPAAVLLALALAGLYAADDRLLSPHGHRAGHRLRDALVTGALASAAGLLTERVLRPKDDPPGHPPPRKGRVKVTVRGSRRADGDDL